MKADPTQEEALLQRNGNDFIVCRIMKVYRFIGELVILTEINPTNPDAVHPMIFQEKLSMVSRLTFGLDVK
jgi:hypothetical protein